MKIRSGKAWGLILCQNDSDQKFELYSLGGNEHNRAGADDERKNGYGDNFKLI